MSTHSYLHSNKEKAQALLGKQKQKSNLHYIKYEPYIPK